jgi:predicted nucleic acid-binding protein
MANEVFVDSSGFFAILVAQDNRHAAAKRFLSNSRKKLLRFVTTDYVLDETATLLKARGNRHLIPVFFDTVFDSLACHVDWIDIDRFQQTQMFYSKHLDHDWSFTDCVSFIVMRQRKLTRALTKDSHFEQMGFMALLK